MSAELPSLRPARAADLEAMFEVERAAFPRPWSRMLLARELEHRWSRQLVLEAPPDGRLVGFIIFWLVADEVHVLDVAVHPREQGRGFGRVLLEACIDAARASGAALITLEVRRSNAAARHLYGAAGFETVGVRPRYYADSREDALVLELRF